MWEVKPLLVEGRERILAAAKKNITIKWLQKVPAAFEEWMQTVKEIYVMEKITHTSNE